MIDMVRSIQRAALGAAAVAAVVVAGACSAPVDETRDRASAPAAEPSSGPGRDKTVPKSSADAPIAADAAPDFTVTTFEGESFSLHEQAGTPVVLNFWESW